MVNLLMSCKCPRACLHVVLRQTDRQTGRGVARAEGDRIIEYIYIYIYIFALGANIREALKGKC